jgi:hypothetical protein
MNSTPGKGRQPFFAQFFSIESSSSSIYCFSLAALLCIGLFYFLSWPVSGGSDTDLWYHLNGGRYLFTHHKPADSGFFSFIANDRQWANYYWLFQAIVYVLHSFFDYYGLIILRTSLYVLTLGSIACYLFRDSKKEINSLYFYIITALLFMALLPRYFAVVRPHIFSYLFIVLFICIFEGRRKAWFFVLPFLAVFWVNVHGVEYPVMMLICFAYLADIFLLRLQTRNPISRETLITIIPVLISMYAVFLTPFGTELLFSPFKSAPNQHLYIVELKKPEFLELINFNFTTVTTSFSALSNLLILAGATGFIVGMVTRRIRISHFLLFVGGLYLLSRADRFRYEIILLSLPLIKSYPPFSLEFQSKKIAGFSQTVAVLVVFCISVFFLHNVFRPRAHYPATTSNVPAGIAAFLNHIKVGGKVLNDPGHGGYLQWELGKEYPIYMDMEMMLFSDEDFFQAINAFLNPEVLGQVVASHRPSFIAPLITNSNFNEIIKKFPNYEPVFFDDVAVLFIDKTRHQEVAEKYKLNTLDPFALKRIDIGALPDDKADLMLAEIQKLEAIFPTGELVNQLLIQFARRKKDYDLALKHAGQLVEYFPEKQIGFQLQGDILLEKKLFEQALASYEKALKLSEGPRKYDIYKKISVSFSKTGKPEEAYKAFKKAIVVFATGTSAAEYYELGRLALQAGKKRDGIMYLRFAQQMLSDDDKEMKARIKGLLLKTALQDQFK